MGFRPTFERYYPISGPTFTGLDLGIISNDWHIQEAADFNGDSKSDILWRNDNGDMCPIYH